MYLIIFEKQKSEEIVEAFAEVITKISAQFTTAESSGLTRYKKHSGSLYYRF